MRKISMKKKSTDSNSTESSDPAHKHDDSDTSMESDNKKSKKSNKRSKKTDDSNGSLSEPVTADTVSEAEENYEVEQILEQKYVKGARHFLIRWKGYGSELDTWEPESTVDCPDLIEKFLESKKPSKAKESLKSKKRSSKNNSKSPKKLKSNADNGEDDDPGEYEESKKRSNKSVHKSPKKSKSNADDGENDSPGEYEESKKRSSRSELKSPKKSKRNTDDSDAGGPGEYEVDRIIEVHHKKNGRREFLVHWKGYTATENTWEPEENMSCPELIDKFMAKVNKVKEFDSRELRTAPKATKPFTLNMVQTGRRLSRRNLGKQRIQYQDNE